MEYGIIASGIRNGVEESSTIDRRVEVLKFPAFDDENEHEHEHEQPGNYVLRENPKKTKRFVDSKELKVCRECGKGFQSLKALCGHMACHSDKERPTSKFKAERKMKKKLVAALDSRSDTESSGPILPKLRRGSRRIRFCKNVAGSVVVEREQQEVAISLMLLSRDSGYKGCQSSVVAESSSNNSVVLEAKSSSIDMLVTTAKRKFASFEDVRSKLNAKASVSEENSDSGYFRHGPKKVKSDVSVDGNCEFKILGVESGSGFDVNRSELGKSLIDEEGSRGFSKYELRKRTRTGIYKAEALLDYYKAEGEEEASNVAQKRSKYECLTCNRTFNSHTALGGHRASHAKINGCFGSTCVESGEISIETDNNNSKTLVNGGLAERKSGSKKSKGHECPICFRMFKSGQALGGHKRSHFLGGREANSTSVIRQEPNPEPEIEVLFDLNLPAPVEEGDVGFIDW